MAKRIKFSAICFKCGVRKGPGEAWLTKIRNVWKCQCDDCYKVITNFQRAKLSTEMKTAEPAKSAQGSADSAQPQVSL